VIGGIFIRALVSQNSAKRAGGQFAGALMTPQLSRA
jgi:hypothetical protein